MLSLATKDPAAPAGAIELRGFSPLVGGSVTQLDPNNTPGDFTDDLVRFVPAPNFNGPATFTYSAGIVGDTIPDDVGVGTITVNVNPVNDGPVISVPAVQNKQEDETVVFSAAGGNAISIVDVDADPGGVQVTLAATNGTITLGGTANLTFVSGDGTADGQMVFKGTTAAVNAALNGLSFVPTRDFSGIASLSIGTSDLGNSGKIAGVALEDQETVTINSRPGMMRRRSRHRFSSQFIRSMTWRSLRPSTMQSVISDVDAGQDSLTVTLSTTNNVGRLSATAVGNAQVTGSGTFQLGIIGLAGFDQCHAGKPVADAAVAWRNADHPRVRPRAQPADGNPECAGDDHHHGVAGGGAIRGQRFAGGTAGGQSQLCDRRAGE